MNNIYICKTPNHLFLSLLRILYNRDNDAVLLVSDEIEKLPNNWVGRYVKEIITYPENYICNQWNIYKRNHPLRLKKGIVKLFSKDFDEKYNFSDRLNYKVYLDSEAIVAYLMLRYNKSHFTLIEDGESIYATPRKGLSHWIKKLIRFPLPYGQSKQVNVVEASFPERLPRAIRDKAVQVEAKGLLKQLSDSNKELLFDFYGVHNIFSEIDSSSSLLLLTQPLSEDGLVSESSKIDLYKEVLKPYCDKYRVFIKPHPRELTDYASVFSDVVVLKNDWPAELLYLANIEFDLSLTLFSTAIHSIASKDNVILGLDYDKNVESAWLKFTDKKKKR